MTRNEAKATVAGYLLDSGVPKDDINEILDALTSINGTDPSLDDVIKKYTEVTNRWIREAEKSSKKNNREEVDISLFHAVENHQITKWLTELKELRRWKEGLKQRHLASEWIIDEREDDRILKCHCAYCGQDPQIWIGGTENWWVRTLPDFCPNCGASMTRKMPKDIKEDD